MTGLFFTAYFNPQAARLVMSDSTGPCNGGNSSMYSCRSRAARMRMFYTQTLREPFSKVLTSVPFTLNTVPLRPARRAAYILAIRTQMNASEAFYSPRRALRGAVVAKFSRRCASPIFS